MFFEGVNLYEQLWEKQTGAAGTLRLNRKGVPLAVKSAKLAVGEVVFRGKEKMLAMKWRDKKDIGFLSTVHSTALVPARCTRQGGKNI